jgi:nitrate reductase gamma subunit
MTSLVYGTIYAAVAVFLIACLVRTLRYARAPLHLRWELYPVAHEERRRAQYGGSYFEELDWWTQPAGFNLLGELKVMAAEIVFLKGLWEFNRKLWWRSFPFHFGLYLLIAAILLLLLSALLVMFAPGLMVGAVGMLLHWLYTLSGLAGAALVMLGALGLLHRRLTDQALKTCTTPGDILNLAFFVVTIGVLAAGYLFRGPASPSTLTVVVGLVTFDSSVGIPGLLAAGLILGSLLAAYIPLTHMSHFIAKYFTYHSVRWDDQPYLRGGDLGRKIAEYLAYRPTWAAPHIQGDGKKTWAEVVMTNPAQRVKK